MDSKAELIAGWIPVQKMVDFDCTLFLAVSLLLHKGYVRLETFCSLILICMILGVAVATSDSWINWAVSRIEPRDKDCLMYDIVSYRSEKYIRQANCHSINVHTGIQLCYCC